MDETQELLQRYQQLTPQEQQTLIAAMTPELATILLQLLPPVYADAIIRATQASPEQVRGAPAGAPAGGLSPAPGLPAAAPPPGAVPPQGGPGGPGGVPPRNVPVGPPPQQQQPQGGGIPGTPQGMDAFARMALGQ